jgi:predicted acylesterase/phospholipase RssA
MVEATDQGIVPLQQMLVPFNSIVVNHLLRKETRELYTSILIKALHEREQQHHNSHFVARTVPYEAWVKEHLKVMEWSKDAKQIPSRLLYRTDLDHLFSDLEQYTALSGQKPRLAVVLSGGGAKCAFQGGVIMALEEKLAALHNKDSHSILKDFDVGLVVGTSGGAVNAMLMSLGITAQNSKDEIRNVWGSMTEDQFFKPSLLFRIAFGILVAATQITLVILVTTLFAGSTVLWPSIRWPVIFLSLLQLLLALYLTVQPFFAFLRFASVFILEIGMFILTRIMIRAFGKRFSDSLRLMGVLLVIMSAPQLAIALLSSICPSIFAVQNHAVAHLLMLVIFVAKWAAPLTFIVGLLLLAPHASSLVRANHKVLLRVMAGVAVLFFALAILTVLREESPSRSDGIRQFLNGHMKTFLKNRGVTANGLSISQQIMKNPWLLKRDLIIAATRLPDPSAPANEPDLYFYALRNGSEKDVDFHHDQHFIALSENPDLLLDVVLGSSTIYPIFPPQPLRHVKTRNPLTPEQDFRIVDGGYSHNTPILAALEWQATHLLVIEASPEPLATEPRDFLDHAGAAFNFLFEEAQRLDTQSRGKIEVFSIRPRSECWKESKMIHCSMSPDPDLDTFDFYPSLLKEAFDRGFSDATESYPTAIGNFIREPGEPLLAPVTKTPRVKVPIRLRSVTSDLTGPTRSSMMTR